MIETRVLQPSRYSRDTIRAPVPFRSCVKKQLKLYKEFPNGASHPDDSSWDYAGARGGNRGFRAGTTTPRPGHGKDSAFQDSARSPGPQARRLPRKSTARGGTYGD